MIIHREIADQAAQRQKIYVMVEAGRIASG